jgi:amino acid efflux transporter
MPIIAAATVVVISIRSGLDITPFVLIHTTPMFAAYALGMIAAVRLLERFSLGG